MYQKILYLASTEWTTSSTTQQIFWVGQFTCLTKLYSASMEPTNFINNSGYGGAIHMFNKTVLSHNGTNNFINNSADGVVGSGAIYTLNNPLLSFNGANNLIHQQLSKCWLWWSYLHMIYTVLSFNGTSTSSKILQPLVIQLAHQTIYCSYLPSMEPTT